MYIVPPHLLQPLPNGGILLHLLPQSNIQFISFALPGVFLRSSPMPKLQPRPAPSQTLVNQVAHLPASDDRDRKYEAEPPRRICTKLFQEAAADIVRPAIPWIVCESQNYIPKPPAGESDEERYQDNARLVMRFDEAARGVVSWCLTPVIFQSLTIACN